MISTYVVALADPIIRYLPVKLHRHKKTTMQNGDIDLKCMYSVNNFFATYVRDSVQLTLTYVLFRGLSKLWYPV